MKPEENDRVVIQLKYEVWARHDEQRAHVKSLSEYVKLALEKVGESADTVVLTGGAPTWLYLAVAQALQGKCFTLIYNSPNTGDVIIFDDEPLITV